MGPAIFPSIQDALSFSFNTVVSAPRQKCGTRLALITIIEGGGALSRCQVAFLNYLYGEKGRINFDGLSGIERFVTCVMVVASVKDHCPDKERFAIWSRHGWGPYKSKGVIKLTRQLYSPLGISYEATRLLLAEQSLPRKERDPEMTFKYISDKTNVPIRTLERAAARLRPLVRGLENAGYDRLYPMFIRDGLIPPFQ